MSILNVNKINPVGGGSTITIAGIASVTSSVTAPSFVGAVTGNVTGNVTGTASGLSGNPSINTTGIVTATSFVPTVGQLSHRNIIVNGAMSLAQRATSSTSSGIHSVDRFGVWYDNVDEAPTQEQYVMNSGDTGPWESGFRNALKVTNGNQTSGAGADDYIWIQNLIEAQDIANSGWNYTSSSSYVTLSFWIKTSVSQSYKCYLRTRDGTQRQYPFETGTVSANTWTKIVKTIPGNSGLQFDNDANQGLQINIGCFFGTNLTASGVTENAWGSWSSTARVPDMTSTWYTTNDAVFRLTGVQLEVGSVATPFEHRSVGDELARCQRYFLRIPSAAASSGYYFLANGAAHDTNAFLCNFHFPTTMRGNPSLSTTGSLRAYNGGGLTISSIILNSASVAGACVQVATSGGLSSKDAVSLGQNNDSDASVQFTAEL